MVKKHFIILFLFLSTSLVFYYNAIANDNVDEDKIKTSIQNTVKDVAKKAGDSATAVLDESKKITVSVYESVKEKGGETIESIIIEPTINTAKDLTKKALLSIGSSVLTKEEIKELIGDESDNCFCQ